VLLPASLGGSSAPEELHNAYISELALADRRRLLQGSQAQDSASTICRTVSCKEEGCDFRIRFESVCIVGESMANLPELVHNQQMVTCDNCLEESWHHLESEGTRLCAHCGNEHDDYAAPSTAGEPEPDEQAEQG
jgi:hypothetical protein